MATLQSSTPDSALTDRERLWAAIRSLRQFSMHELCLKSKVDRRTSKPRDYVSALVKSGILRVVSVGGVGQFNVYALQEDKGVCAPRVRKDGTRLPDSGRTRMWQAMAILKTFTARELVNAASLPDAPIAEAEAAYYCRWLEDGGYLIRLNAHAWVIIPARQTGPKAPQVLRVRELYDPNTGKIVTRGKPEGRDDE